MLVHHQGLLFYELHCKVIPEGERASQWCRVHLKVVHVATHMHASCSKHQLDGALRGASDTKFCVHFYNFASLPLPAGGPIILQCKTMLLTTRLIESTVQIQDHDPAILRSIVLNLSQCSRRAFSTIRSLKVYSAADEDRRL